MVFVYLIIPALLMILWFLAKDTVVDSEVKEDGISRELLKISLFLYQKIGSKKRFAWEQKVRGYLTTLNGSRNPEKEISYYYAQKISIVLLLAACGSFLSLALYITEANDGAIRDGYVVDRNAAGEGAKDLDLVATGGDGKELGEFHLEIEEQKFTEKEAEELFKRASGELEQMILGNNESLELVNDDLKLIKQIEGYPFEISWSIDNPDVCKYDGEIDFEKVPEEGVIIALTATYRYNEHRLEQVMYANVVPQKLTPAQIVQKEIKTLLDTGNRESEYEDHIDLPSTYRDESISWSEKRQDSSLMLLLLMLVGGAATFVMKDNELKQKIEYRNNQLIREYPGFVSQMVLYLGAGMTMRNIFSKLSENYIGKRKNGAPESVVYEEIIKSSREMGLGKAESAVYEDFGRRCGGQQYSRLSTLLAQNLRKGNSELLKLLNEEAQKAFDDRLDRARKSGEEAGTKLLLPMVLMLLIVMVIIMIPAYMTF